MMECYSALKRNESSNQEKIYRKLRWIPLNEISQSVKIMYYNSKSLTFWKGQNYGESKKKQKQQQNKIKKQQLPESEARGREIGGAQRIFKDSKKQFCIML